MRVGRAQNEKIRLAGDGDVIGITAGSGQKPLVLDAPNGLADAKPAHGSSFDAGLNFGLKCGVAPKYSAGSGLVHAGARRRARYG